MPKGEDLKWKCCGLTMINGNPYFKVKLLHKSHTSKYRILVDGPINKEYEFKGWAAADAKYQEITKELNHQYLKK